MTTQNSLSQIPEYLFPYIAEQNPSLYTPMDHASWRYILKISQGFFAKHAHQKYLDGLKETGISTESIPLIQDMSRCLKRFQWQAVPVTGFIPPAVFMEFLSLGVLPIACDMRTLDHLAYTPAPDIVHEAAGHAPIVADPEYRDYLRSYGEISRKAIYSDQDMEVYQAIRNLSDVKEDPKSTSTDIQKAQRRLDEAVAAQTYISEATFLSRMGWWTFEYGLIGDLHSPKIYGAGLLSSMGESYHCLSPEVKKISFSIDCVETTYDITKPQPQLFVSPDFKTLKEGLEQLGNRMAFRKGGVEGLQKAKQAKTVTTVELETGVQVSGVLADFVPDSSGRPCYLKYQGPTQLSYQNEEISGQGAKYHAQGFGTPLEVVTEIDLEKAGVLHGRKGRLLLQSGVSIEGRCTDFLKKAGKIILVTFEDCTVKKGDEFLFRPEWGKYDIVCGEKVVSVFADAADRKSYLAATGGFHQEPGRQKTNLTAENRELNQLYAEVRKIREAGKYDSASEKKLSEIHQLLKARYSEDWLLRYEILEISVKQNLKATDRESLKTELNTLSGKSKEMGEMIQRGLDLIYAS